MLRRKNKIFCIGFNKTGTTSISRAFKDLGMKVGEQSDAELLFDDWVVRKNDKLVKYCKKYQVFQDIPFSLPYTFIALDNAFPNSKFILTIRDSPEDWYNSLVSFHSKLWSKKNTVPTAKELAEATYLYKGFALKSILFFYGTTKENPYNKQLMIKQYVQHIENVRTYFKYRENDLLEINISDKTSYKTFCEFIGKKPLYNEFPWLNRTK